MTSHSIIQRIARPAGAMFLTIAGMAGLLSGCDRIGSSASTQSTQPSAEEIAIRTAPPEQVFQGTLAGQTVHLVVHDCEVLSVRQTAQGRLEWKSVLAPEPYPFPTSCERQSLSFDAGQVTARLGRRAFGAGGCCASGGTYRSADGLIWKRL
ncbi:hypothetical protein SAMN05518845_107138 [Variovorax sp. YR750]|uniref:hypothetical protein n=1 Tax=Variovorax sp. YR750 TaxID=1884384 RepID=UPI0008B41526|nr:hypothetical protein [Variovorax sp. YR750]SEL42860.1 hypothetical protein SAMN05518845_107138 [Variovorax sp. YR750]